MKSKAAQPNCSTLVGVVFAVCVSSLVKWILSTHPHSGEKQPPMYGDYEAQRHWMEITYNLPVSQWYHNSSDNDLMYWGLDYPPLTAYHSYLMGVVASKINTSWVSLFNSRGEESYNHKFFMRSSVFFVDFFIFVPAVICFILKFGKLKENVVKACAIFTFLVFPGFLLIDYGHFQYNCASLGLFLWAVNFILWDVDLVACVLFVCSLNYKQMELYHSLPFFSYLLGKCVKYWSFQGLFKLVSIALTVIGTFVIIWYPFLSIPEISQVIQRIFPVARGVFEDKVANFWCASSILFKWKLWFTQEVMTCITGSATLLMCSPSSLMLLTSANKSQFKYSLVNCSLAFFLFSFQVHEKSVLIVALPILLLINEEVLPSAWFLLISVISLHPLMLKDKLGLSFYTLSIFYYVWLSDVYQLNQFKTGKGKMEKWKFEVVIFHSSIIFGFLLCFVGVLVRAPDHYPHLWTLLNCVYCCAIFSAFFMYFNYKQWALWRNKHFKRKLH